MSLGAGTLPCSSSHPQGPAVLSCSAEHFTWAWCTPLPLSPRLLWLLTFSFCMLASASNDHTAWGTCLPQFPQGSSRDESAGNHGLSLEDQTHECVSSELGSRGAFGFFVAGGQERLGLPTQWGRHVTSPFSASRGQEGTGGTSLCSVCSPIPFLCWKTHSVRPAVDRCRGSGCDHAHCSLLGGFIGGGCGWEELVHTSTIEAGHTVAA